MNYDVVIVGAGIAGLYSAYRLLQSNPSLRLLIVEKSSLLGGRVHSIQDASGRWQELGAYRISPDIHPQFLNLAHELGYRFPQDFEYLDQEKKQYALRQPYRKGHTNLSQQIDNYDLPWYDRWILKLFGESVFSIIVHSSKWVRSIAPKKVLQKYSLADAMKHLLGFSDEMIRFIDDAIGYYTLNNLNAWDALQESVVMGPPRGFYRFKPGLTAIIHRLADFIVSHPNAKIQLNTQLTQLSKINAEYYELSTRSIEQKAQSNWFCGTQTEQENSFPGMQIQAKCVILAVPQVSLQILFPQFPMWNTVTSNALMRLFVGFPTRWFPWRNNTFVMSSSPIRQFFPINLSSNIMEIYADNDVALFWHKHVQQDTIKEAIQRELQKVFVDYSVPLPSFVITDFCPHASHSWKAKVDSQSMSKRIRHPFPEENIWVVGEAFAPKFQGWLSGSLISVDLFIREWTKYH